MGQRCFNTLYFYCDVRWMMLIKLHFCDSANNPKLESVIPSHPILSKQVVTEAEEDAWKLTYGYEDKCRDDIWKERGWRSAAAFKRAADKLEQNRLEYGYISLRHWRLWNWGTEELPVDGKPIQLADDRPGERHAWEFDTLRYPPWMVIHRLSQQIKHVPMLLSAYSCAMEGLCSTAFYAGYKVKVRPFMRCMRSRKTSATRPLPQPFNGT